MSDITISVSEERLTELKNKSSSLGIKLEDLILLSIEDLLSRPDEDFKHAMRYILQKNAELYRRLA
jgi:hypothetical protein